MTGPKFQAELEQPFTGAWVNVEVRSLLNNLASQRKVAVLLDRRVDPTVRLPVDIVNRPLKDAFREIASGVRAETCFPDNLVFVGPVAAVNKLRTLIELRSQELQSKANAIPERRRLELAKRHSVTWEDLETPENILRRIAEQWHLTIQHPERITHDLWAQSRLPSVSAAESLSLVLIQFDLTFTWADGGQAVDLISIPDHATVERRIRSKGRATADTLKQVLDQFPDLQARLDGNELIVTGTLEDHEAVATFLNPSVPKRNTSTATMPLRQQTFAEIKLERVRVRDIMKKLEESKVVFVYDVDALAAAGIDLDRTVDLQLTNATADELLKAVFSPLNLKYEIDNLTVKLTPKK